MDKVAQAERRAEILRERAMRSLTKLDADPTCNPRRVPVSAWVDLIEAPRDLIDCILDNLEHELLHYDLDAEDQAIYDAVSDVDEYMGAVRRVESEKKNAERERIGNIIAHKKREKKKKQKAGAQNG